jgi:hypothetical protein
MVNLIITAQNYVTKWEPGDRLAAFGSVALVGSPDMYAMPLIEQISVEPDTHGGFDVAILTIWIGEGHGGMAELRFDPEHRVTIYRPRKATEPEIALALPTTRLAR